MTATNSVQYGDGGAGGTFTGNTVIGSGFGAAGAASAAILLSSAANVTIDNNTITGAGTDIGIAVSSSTNVTISNNAVGRTAPDSLTQWNRDRGRCGGSFDRVSTGPPPVPRHRCPRM